MEKHIDWSRYKFHCSGLSNLLVTSRKKGELSETTKSYLKEIYLKEVWGREKTDLVGNKFVRKGIMCETDSLELVERVTGKTLFKNNKQLENDFIVGTPDVIDPSLEDVKSSWDLFTFVAVTEEKARKDYAHQMIGYTWLVDTDRANLNYCLMDTPEDIIQSELNRLSFFLPYDQVKKYENNFRFGDIPENMKLKQYVIERDNEIIDRMKAVIPKCRSYLENLSL